jgi:hypothetical protein
MFFFPPPFPFVKFNSFICQVYVDDCQAVAGIARLAKPIPGLGAPLPVTINASFERSVISIPESVSGSETEIYKEHRLTVSESWVLTRV